MAAGAETDKVGPGRQFRTDPRAGLKHVFRWIRNPVSLEGASNVPKMKMAMGGPEYHARVEDMRAHPDGRRILQDRPDLGLVLAEDRLGELPEGTLGRTYHGHANVEGAVPGYLLAGQLYRGPEFDRLDWDDDLKFLLYRMNNTHDLIHQLCGYGTDLAGESLTIAYTMGLEAMQPDKARRLAKLWVYLSWCMMAPSIGFRKYRQFILEAFDRGVATGACCAPHNMYFEELLDVTVPDVRRRFGVPPLAEPFDTLDWTLSALGERIARGYRSSEDDGASQRLAWVDTLVQAGIPVKTLVNLKDSTLDELLSRAEQGAAEDELRSLAGMF
ncbi:MAG: hypothetical protein Hals2KO_19570 [Halioglobus sp.]